MMDIIRIQIVNYKTKSYLIECLASVAEDLRDFPGGYSVAVVDNDSGEDLSDLAGRFTGLKLEMYRAGQNLGFGAGNNLIAKHGDARWLLLLNPDTKIIQAQTIKRLIECAEDSQADVVGPRLLTESGSTQQWDHGELRGLRAWIALNSGNSFWRERRRPEVVAWVSGAVFLIKKERFDGLGGFDEHFFLYKEEEELCWRLRAGGGKVIYDPTITVFHKGGVVAKKSDHMQSSVGYFLDKHFRKRPGYGFFKLLNKIMH